MTEPRTVAGLRQVASDFDAVLVDQFGVMHDGRKPYEGAVEALAQLTRFGKAVIVLTNSGKRAAPNIDRIVGIGFPPSTFTGLVSSGEVAWAGIRNGTFGAPFVTGARAGIIGKAGDDYGFHDLGLAFVEDLGDADILLMMGSDCPRTSLEEYRETLIPAAVRRVPALCCNPDMTMLTARGPQPSVGAIAQVYAALGGPVTFVGKPHGAIYREAARLADAKPPRILAVGDSLDHDVTGGANAGLRTALVRTGILAEMDEAAFAARIGAAVDKPDFILPALRW